EIGALAPLRRHVETELHLFPPPTASLTYTRPSAMEGTLGTSPGGRVAGKIALVTGAANGLGRAIALRLAEEGATLVLVDIDSGGLVETERQLKAAQAGSNQPPLCITADVTEEAPVKALFQQALAMHGRIDILVNDVG